MDSIRFFNVLLLVAAVVCGISLVACETTTSEIPTVTPCNKMCTFIYKPVCGSDGKTYSNECVFQSLTCLDGIDAKMDHEGAC